LVGMLRTRKCWSTGLENAAARTFAPRFSFAQQAFPLIPTALQSLTDGSEQLI
jgi:hypothetical protein